MEIDLLPSKYTLISMEEVPDCRGTGYLLKHKKSGARIAVISNNDPNKSFCIAFRTPPKDDTGVAHILEHSVLCGSRKFKPKDPFMEMAKGSLNTYLNALTYPDKTCYPVASCNAQDFANLMDVYLDAVFYPAIYEHREIFMQEGWHYELEDAESDLELNGIVYSEMKGVFSSPEERLARRTMRELFPDNAYFYESGGDPAAIPNLTYEDFLEFHKKYYHPSNSYISLYGDLDVTERLEFLDREYLSAFDATEPAPCMKSQPPIGERFSEGIYPLAEGDPEEDAAFINWAFRLADCGDIKTNTALGLICQVLFDITGAPVKEALVKKGLGKEVSFIVEDEILEPFGTLSIRNIDAAKLPEVKQTVTSALKQVVAEGLNKRSLQSALTRMEFSFCEEDFGSMPKGLIYIFRSLGTWLYDDRAAFTGLCVRKLFEELRTLIDTDYYENLVREYMLECESSVWCVLKPKKGLDREEDEALGEELRAFKESLSKEQIEETVRMTEHLRDYQQTPPTPEELMTVPMLRREDIERKGFVPINEELEVHGVPTVLHETETNGIFYIDAMFEVSGIETAEVPYLGLMLRLLGNLDTKNYTYLELDNESGIHTGGIGASVSTYVVDGTDDYRPVLSMSGKAFAREAAALMSLISEVFFDTDFSSLSRAREVIGECITNMRGVFASAGHRVAMMSARAAVSSSDAFTAALSGREYYELLCRLESSTDEELVKAIECGRKVLGRIVRKSGLTFNITATREIFDGLGEALLGYIKRIEEFGEAQAAVAGQTGCAGENKPADTGTRRDCEEKPENTGKGCAGENKPADTGTGCDCEEKPENTGTGCAGENKPADTGTGCDCEEKPENTGKRCAGENKSERAEAGCEGEKHDRKRDPQGRGPKYETGSRQLAFKNAGDVNYVALAGIHECSSPEEAGHFCILASILSNEYLWNNIRVLGGAYGCGFSYRRQCGSMAFYSYRDPAIGETLETYKSAPDYIESFDVDEREMTKFIIGTIGAIDTPMTPDMKGRFSLSCYMSGVDGDWVQRRRDAILSASCEDIRRLAGAVRKVTEAGNICVVGSESDIERENKLFTEIRNLY